MKKRTQNAYRVEVELKGCKCCRAGRTWMVVDPNESAGGTVYGNKEDADEIAEMLNEAFELGRKSAVEQKR